MVHPCIAEQKCIRREDNKIQYYNWKVKNVPYYRFCKVRNKLQIVIMQLDESVLLYFDLHGG